MRAPVRQIATFVGFLCEDLGDQISSDAARNLEFIRQGTTRLSNLIDGLQELTELNTRSLEIGKNRLTTGLPVRIGMIEADLPDPEPWVLVDPGLLRAIWPRLLAAAVRLAGDDLPVRLTASSTDELRVRCFVDVREPRLSVADVTSAFAPFGAVSARLNAAGIDLAVCYKALSCMQGTLSAEEGPDGCLRLVMELPSAPAPSPLTPADSPA